MWKVMGTDTVLIKAGDVWAGKLLELSARKRDAQRFRDLMARAEVNYWFDAIREIHTFYLKFPKSTKAEDLEFLRDFMLKVQKGAKVPVIEYDGEPQKYTIVLTADEEEDAHKGRNPWWEKYEKEQKTQAI